MDDTTHSTTDYSAWASDPDNLALHLEAILNSLTATTPPHAGHVTSPSRRPYTVNPDTGHLNGHALCWICASGLAHTGRNLPLLRACRWCLVEDRTHAARLGLGHLLPVFDWPAPPVRDPKWANRLDGPARDAVARAWSAVSVLDRWRRDSVRLAHAWMDVPDGQAVDLPEWQSRLTLGPNRSRACWAAYIDGYHPALRRALRATPVSTGVTR